MKARDLKPPAPAADPIAAALRATLGELVRDAVHEAFAELRDGEPSRPAVLTSDQLCAALQTSRPTLYRLRAEGLPCVLVGDSPRYDLAAVLSWLHTRSEARRAG